MMRIMKMRLKALADIYYKKEDADNFNKAYKKVSG